MDYVEITFENMDYAKVPLSCFSHFSMQNIETVIEMLEAYFYPPDKSDDSSNCAVPSKRLNKYHCIKDLSFSLPADTYLNTDWCGDSLLSRLKDRDIAQLDLIYSDGTSEKYYVSWSTDKDAPSCNSLQKSYLSDGLLHVEICDRKSNI